MWEFVVGFLLGVYFWRCWTWPRTSKVRPGLNSDIMVPHQDSLELHHNMLSSCSQKVRACLGETGLQHRKIHHVLPSSGGWETKSSEYLSINPAGTVPVLVHNGHPVYESHEQIVYIDQVLMPGGPKLTPRDPEMKMLMDKWVASGAMIISELSETDDIFDGVKKRFGNTLGPMTMPLFCAKNVLEFDFMVILQSLSMIPLIKDRKMLMMIIIFKMFGVEAFQKVKFLDKMVSVALRGICHHFEILTKDLAAHEGPYICGEEYTLAEISLIPIFERMQYAGWWTEEVKAKFPEVTRYWEIIQEREGYKASKPDQQMHKKLIKVSNLVDKWKREYQWFQKYYTI